MDRQYILDEIRRIADATDGKPVGASRFEQLTGIRRADWQGRYWVRWGDAVREAGFTPRTLTPRAEREAVIEAYVDFVRRLGRLPVKNELLMEARSTKGFPWPTTVARHLGRSRHLVMAVRAYCQERGGAYIDLLEMLPEVADDDGPREARSTPGPVIGIVYLMRSGRHYKIGRTNASGRRQYELAIQLPDRATLVHEIRTDDPEGIEAYWHKRFAAKRGNGEWFSLTGPDVDAFRRRKFM